MEIKREIYQNILEERTRLENNYPPDYQNDYSCANFLIRCDGNADIVLNLARKTLLTVSYQYEQNEWPNNSGWEKIIMEDFVKNFEKNNLARNKSYNEKMSIFTYNFISKIFNKKGKRWTFDNWIFWFLPDEDRMWFWKGAEVIDKEKNKFILFTAKILDNPFPSGALRWLFLGSGAIEVMDEDEFSSKYRYKIYLNKHIKNN